MLILNFMACNNDEISLSDDEHNLNTEEMLSHEIVIQERIDKGPVKLRLEIPKATASDFISSDPIYLLGRSYQAKEKPISNISNFSYHVIDIIKLAEDHKYSVLPTSKLKTEIDYFSYASFSKYEINSSSTQKIKQGTNFNIAILNIGTDVTMTRTFTSNYVNQENVVFGELNVNYLGNKYDLQTTNAALQEIRKKYINDLFLRDLYNYPIHETLDGYGSHVLTSFYGGARLTALYAGKHRSNSSTETKEKDMDIAVNGSFKINDLITIGGNQGIGGKYTDKISIDKSFSELMLSVKAEGGIPSANMTGNAQKIENIEITIDEWLKSLSDSKLHVLSDINQEGLVPITEFIEEENFKENIKKVIQNFNIGYNYYDKGLRIPFLTVVYYSEASERVDYNKWYPNYVLLRTRTGEKIFMSNFSTDSRYYHYIHKSESKGSNSTEMLAKCDAIMTKISKTFLANEISPYFKCKVNAVTAWAFLFGHENDLTLPIEVGLGAYGDFKSARKYEDKERGFKYILLKKTDSDATKDIALSMYDDYLLDTYGIRDWYNSMPSVSMTYDNLLRTHRIIGL